MRPTTKANQFAVSAPDIVITPIILLPQTLTIASGGSTQTFSPQGGHGPYTFAMISGAGSVDATTGVYTSATAGTDVVGVTDSLSNTAQSTVTVI